MFWGSEDVTILLKGFEIWEKFSVLRLLGVRNTHLTLILIPACKISIKNLSLRFFQGFFVANLNKKMNPGVKF